MAAPHKGENLSKFMSKYMDEDESSEGRYKRRKKKRHEDEAEDQELIRREVKPSALKPKYR
jgi:hypothetical protein